MNDAGAGTLIGKRIGLLLGRVVLKTRFSVPEALRLIAWDASPCHDPHLFDPAGISDGCRRSRSAPTENRFLDAVFDPGGRRRPRAGWLCDALRGRIAVKEPRHP